MNAAQVPTLKEARQLARAEGKAIEIDVLLADDTIARVVVGPRGAWRKVGRRNL